MVGGGAIDGFAEGGVIDGGAIDGFAEGGAIEGFTGGGAMDGGAIEGFTEGGAIDALGAELGDAVGGLPTLVGVGPAEVIEAMAGLCGVVDAAEAKEPLNRAAPAAMAPPAARLRTVTRWLRPRGCWWPDFRRVAM